MFRPTFVTHPERGEIFFSSILNRHGSWLDDHDYFGTVPLNERPYHCTWADGSELSDDELVELRATRLLLLGRCTRLTLLFHSSGRLSSK